MRFAPSGGRRAVQGDPPATLQTLVDRFDPAVFDAAGTARIRIWGAAEDPWDAVIDDHQSVLEPADRSRHADAILSSDPPTWRRIVRDLRAGMAAFRRGRLSVRRDLHLGVGFLAATADAAQPSRLHFSSVETDAGTISMMESGEGPPVLMLHGLGATKASFLPTVTALSEHHRVIAIDLPGFGNSDKPLGGRYDASFFADAATAVLDALGIERAVIVGNSMGGRAAIEVGLRAPERVDRLVLLAPSLAWLRSRPWAAALRLVPPQLGAIQPAPRRVVDGVMRRLVPTSHEGWTAAGVDEFVRSYVEPRGRAAFYAAARNIYLEEPHGPDGFWSRLAQLEPEALFIWGRQDSLVPIGFARHVERVLPRARHIELDCGHVPQLEAPDETHRAMVRLLAGRRAKRRRPAARRSKPASAGRIAS